MILAINRMTETSNLVFDFKISKLEIDLFSSIKIQAY